MTSSMPSSGDSGTAPGNEAQADLAQLVVPPTELGGTTADGSSEPADADDLKEEHEAPLQWSIYDALPEVWSEHEASLARWKQGDLVTDVPLTWLTMPGLDSITGLFNDKPEIRPAFDRRLKITAIVCSQTCDLGATPPGDKHPFVLLAPLISLSEIPGNSVRKLAAEGKIGYLFKTATPPTPEQPVEPSGPDDEAPDKRVARPETWFADLRLIFPASKALLLARDPQAGFTEEAESLRFGDTIALKFKRPALDEILSEALPQALRKFVQDNGSRGQAFAKVEQVRLLILAGGRLHPGRAHLYVLTDGVELNEAEAAVWARFQLVVDALFAKAGIILAPMIHADVNILSAAKYRESVPVRCELLGSVIWF